MFGSEVLEVSIGLALVFLLASTLMAAQEGLEAFLQTRAAFLEQAIGELMQGDQESLKALYDHPLVFALYRGGTAGGAGPSAKKLPAYIPREVFSATLIDMVQTGERLPDRLRNAYEGLDRLTGGDAARLRREIEGWYDGVMDRASGRFKKRSQRNVFFIGLVAAIALNINAISIAQYLNANDAQRLLVVGVAEGVVQQRGGKPEIAPLDNEAAKNLQVQLTEIGMPIGWSEASTRWLWPPKPAAARGGAAGTADYSFMRWILVIVGWLMTALAMMLGAPFWFDVLNRLMVIRSTVKPKEKSPDEPSEDGGKAPPSTSTDVSTGVSTGEAPSGGAAPTGPERDRLAPDTVQPIYG